MPLAFSYIFFYPAVFLLSLPLSVQAQDFYVEMKWEFTSWGESSHCITPVGKAVQHRPVRTNHVIVSLWGWRRLFVPVLLDTDAHTLPILQPGFVFRLNQLGLFNLKCFTKPQVEVFSVLVSENMRENENDEPKTEKCCTAFCTRPIEMAHFHLKCVCVCPQCPWCLVSAPATPTEFGRAVSASVLTPPWLALNRWPGREETGASFSGEQVRV